jgi:hypothetical protein
MIAEASNISGAGLTRRAANRRARAVPSADYIEALLAHRLGAFDGAVFACRKIFICSDSELLYISSEIT